MSRNSSPRSRGEGQSLRNRIITCLSEALLWGLMGGFLFACAWWGYLR